MTTADIIAADLARLAETERRGPSAALAADIARAEAAGVDYLVWISASPKEN